MTKDDYESKRRTLEAELKEALARRNKADIERRAKEKELHELDQEFIKKTIAAGEAKEAGRKPR